MRPDMLLGGKKVGTTFDINFFNVTGVLHLPPSGIVSSRFIPKG